MNRQQRRAAAKKRPIGPDRPQFINERARGIANLFERGVAYHQAGQLQQAEAAYRQLLTIEPNHADAHNNLGVVLKRRGDLDGAIAEYREAIRLAPHYALPRHNLVHALQGKGDWDGAIAEYRAAIRLYPKDASHHNALAWILATGPDGVRDGRLAVAHATRACELTN